MAAWLGSTLAHGDSHPDVPTWDQWTPGQVAQKAMGLPIAGPVGVGSMTHTLLEGKGQIKGLRSEVRKVPRRIGVDEPHSNYLIDAKVGGLEDTANRMGTVKVPTKPIRRIGIDKP